LSDGGDVSGLDAGASDGFADADGRQFARRDVFQAPAEAADRRPRAAQDDDLT
jgi:hypothetical protein